MNKKRNDVEMIEKYLNNELTETEVEFIELKLASDPDFRKLANDLDLLIEGVRKEGAKHSKDELIESLKHTISIELPDDDEEDSNVFPIKRVWVKWAAAAVIALVAVSTIIVGPFSSNSNEEIFASHFVPYENNYYSPVRGEEEIKNKEIHNAFFAYDNENYKLAAETFDKLQDHEDYKSSFTIYHGISYLAIGETDDAISILKSVDEDAGMYNRAQWYLALAYIKVDTPNETEKAKAILENLSNTTAKFGKQARELTEELN